MKRVLVTLACALAGLGIAADVAHAAGPDPWINELHYDDAGADSAEGVELAGAAGTSLTGWSLVLVNGVDGQVYATVPVTDTLPDQQAGFGTAWVPIPGIQNGARDAVALVAPGGRVAQLLGYEGASTVVSGPAAGLTAVSITPFEAPSTPDGSSLQLGGTGNAAADFRWARPAPATPGQVNRTQRFAAVVAPVVPSALPTTGAPALPTLGYAEGPDGPLSLTDAAGATVVHLLLRRPAGVTVRVRRAAGGRRLGTRCLMPSPALRDLAPCLRYGPVIASRVLAADAGEARLRLTDAPFAGLPAGAYRITIRVAGQRSRRIYVRVAA
jgi:hypothetical protein